MSEHRVFGNAVGAWPVTAMGRAVKAPSPRALPRVVHSTSSAKAAPQQGKSSVRWRTYRVVVLDCDNRHIARRACGDGTRKPPAASAARRDRIHDSLYDQHDECGPGRHLLTT